jgi:hypothetical protein
LSIDAGPVQAQLAGFVVTGSLSSVAEVVNQTIKTSSTVVMGSLTLMMAQVRGPWEGHGQVFNSRSNNLGLNIPAITTSPQNKSVMMEPPQATNSTAGRGVWLQPHTAAHHIDQSTPQ